jgi:large subunit ribosomal protein L30
MAGKLKITLIKSPLGRIRNQIKTVRALGLRRIRYTVEKNDNAAIRGMINKVSHLVDVKES